MLIADQVMAVAPAEVEDYEWWSRDKTKLPDHEKIVNEHVLFMQWARHAMSFVIDELAEETFAKEPPVAMEELLSTPFPVTLFEYRAPSKTITEDQLQWSRVAVLVAMEGHFALLAGQVAPNEVRKGALPQLIAHCSLQEDLQRASFGLSQLERSRLLVSGHDVNEDTIAGFVAPYVQLFEPALYTIQMLNCKNVTTEEVLPSRQQRRSDERRGVARAKQYRIVVKVPGKGAMPITGARQPTGASSRSLHPVRGHFAEYSEERPLFGKYVGRFWIPAHIRGAGDLTGARGYVVKNRKTEPSIETRDS